jgi:chaperone BCS1
VLLLEDLDAAFVRTTNREDDFGGDNQGNEGQNGGNGNGNGGGIDTSAFPGSGLSGRGLGRRRYGRSDGLSDMNTLSLSGLLNALDGVAASEGRLLFAYVILLVKIECPID